VLDEQLSYWREQLKGAPALLELPTDRPRPAVQSYRGAYESLTISRELLEQLNQLSQHEGTTLFMTLLAAFQILLAHYSGRDDIVVGTNVAGRNRPELEELIGIFINTLVIRTDLSGNPTFSEALRRVRKVGLEAHAHQDVPFEKFVETLKPKRSPSYSPLFQVKIDLLKNAKMALNFSNIKSSVFGHEGENSRYDMFLVLAETENGLRGAWNYNPDLFDRTTIGRLAQAFIMVLESLVKSPEAQISALQSFAATGKEGKNGEKKLTSSGFKKFKGTQLKAIKVLRQSLVKAESLNQGQSLPLLVRPTVEMLDLSAWAANNRDLIATQLREHGAILFRDFSIESITKFEQFIKTVSGELLQYQDGSSPRSRIAGNIYSSTDHPPDQSIFLHNENSYSYSWPLKLFFYCVTPASQGGETPIAGSRRISQRISPRIKELFMKKSVMYVRNFGNGFGLPWQTVFQTDDRTALESYCKSIGIEVRWKGPNHLQTCQVRPALAKHPDTGEMLWFNHAVFFHISTLEQSLRESLLSGFAEEDLPYNTYYGDGTPIEPDVLDELREIYRQETVLFPWRRSDVLMIDNMLAAHGRRPYVGARQIVVGMAEPFHS
jgi:alpha-ketoglutarate-dependent taurine dioxygenase